LQIHGAFADLVRNKCRWRLLETAGPRATAREGAGSWPNSSLPAASTQGGAVHLDKAVARRIPMEGVGASLLSPFPFSRSAPLPRRRHAPDRLEHLHHRRAAPPIPRRRRPRTAPRQRSTWAPASAASGRGARRTARRRVERLGDVSRRRRVSSPRWRRAAAVGRHHDTAS